MDKGRLFFAFFILLAFCRRADNLYAQNITHLNFENGLEVKGKTNDSFYQWKPYIRVGETNPQRCTLPQIKANAYTEINAEKYRRGKHSGKLTLDVSNGGVGHKAMFRYNMLPEGIQLQKTKDERWVSFSCYLSDEGDDKWETDAVPELIFQMHNDIAVSPMLAIYSQSDTFDIIYRFSDIDPHVADVSERSAIGTMKAWSGKAEKGKWIDWVFHVKFSPLTPDGFLQVWINDGIGYRKIVDKQGIRIGYNCSERTDLDIGIYKWSWKCPSDSGIKKRILYIDEISVGDRTANFESITKYLSDFKKK